MPATWQRGFTCRSVDSKVFSRLNAFPMLPVPRRPYKFSQNWLESLRSLGAFEVGKQGFGENDHRAKHLPSEREVWIGVVAGNC